MTNEEILKQAIEKAVENGWDMTSIQEGEDFDLVSDNNEFKIITPQYLIGGSRGADYKETFNIFEVIFSHSFAKAFWKDAEHTCDFCGIEECVRVGNDDHILEGWEEKGMLMFLEEEPLKYIEKFL